MTVPLLKYYDIGIPIIARAYGEASAASTKAVLVVSSPLYTTVACNQT